MKIYAFADEASPFIDGQIKALKENGLDGLEIRNVDNVNVSDISDAKAKEVKKKLDDAGLAVWSVGSPIGKIDIVKDDFNLHTEKFRRTLEIAEILGAENIRLFSFYIPKESDPSEYRNEVIDRLGKFLGIASGTGIDLCHENEKGIYGEKTEGVLDIMKQFGNGYKCIFDPANFIQADVKTYPEAFGKLEEYIYYMHIKDCRADKTVAPAGKGEGKIPEILSELDKKRSDTVVLTVEPHLRVFAGLAALEESGNTTEIIDQYPTSQAAFNAAVSAIKKILADMGK